MARDIKGLLQDYRPEPKKMAKGHESRFEARLKANFSEKNFNKKNSSIPWTKVAAVVVVFLSVGFFGYLQLSKSGAKLTNGTQHSIVGGNSERVTKKESPQLTLAAISPDLKKLQDYYMTGINVQLASLKVTEENKELVDGYMLRLAELDQEYTVLNTELGRVGPTEATVTALIDNLKLRLDLLFKLKNKLKELKTQNDNAFKTIQS